MTTFRLFSARILTTLLVGAGIIMATGSVSVTRAASITWGSATTITDTSDVYTAGTTSYAYNWANLHPRIVNGVAFLGATYGRTSGTGGGADVAFSGGTQNATAYKSISAPFTDLATEYQEDLTGANFATSFTVTLKNLIAGRNYAVQVWCNDSRVNQGYTMTLDDLGGNSVVLNKNTTNAAGGVGQYAIGTFTADAATQTFTITSATASQAQINALQVRDLSPSVWSAAATISGTNDVDTTGNKLYAYNWANNVVRLVNGVTFKNGATASGAGTDVDFSASGTVNGTAFGENYSPFSTLAAYYQDILKGGGYLNSPFTVTLNNLTVGRDYAVQVWYHDTRHEFDTVFETITSDGANRVVLQKNTINADGGLGQYTIGTFTAVGTTKEFTVSSPSANHSQINALQVRDVSATPLASAIIWGDATTIAGVSDVSTAGYLAYAYTWANANQTVNGVDFAGVNTTTGAGTDVIFSGATGGNTSVYATDTGLPAQYVGILRGAVSATSMQVTLANLTIGKKYAVQLWYNDSRTGYPYNMYVESRAGNLVTLRKNTTNTNGGVGQYAIGTFTADAATKTFSVSCVVANNAQINALQVRDIPSEGMVISIK